jgi:hypothetical protein
MNIKIPNRQRWLLVIAGAGVLLLILDRVVFTPMGEAWKADSAEIVRLRNSVADGRSLVSRGPRLQQVWAGMQSGALPRDPAQSQHDVLAGFENWSRSAGVELGSVKPQWKRGAADDTSLLECRLDATGTMGALSRFLYDVESAPLALHVESAELLSRDDSGQRITLNLIVTGLRLSPLEGKP